MGGAQRRQSARIFKESAGHECIEALHTSEVDPKNEQ